MDADWVAMLSLLTVGLFTGVLSGLFGLGGGFLLVPMLALQGWSMPMAIGTSLLYVAAIGLSGAITHWRGANVDRRFVAIFSLTSVVAAPVGAYLSGLLPEAWLAVAFGVFLAAMSLSLGSKPSAVEGATAPAPRTLPTLGLGGLVGVMSGLFGVGGGLVFVPAQVAWFAIPIKRAIGNSLTAIVVTGFAGLAAHYALGQVDWRSGAVLIIGGLLGLKGGHRLFKVTPGETLKRLLVGFLLLLAAGMIWRGVVGR